LGWAWLAWWTLLWRALWWRRTLLGWALSKSNGSEGERRGHQYQSSFGGIGAAGFGLAIQGGLNGWVEEEVAN